MNNWNLTYTEEKNIIPCVRQEHGTFNQTCDWIMVPVHFKKTILLKVLDWDVYTLFAILPHLTPTTIWDNIAIVVNYTTWATHDFLTQDPQHFTHDPQLL